MPTDTLIEQPKPSPQTWESYPVSYSDESLAVAVQALDPDLVIEDTVSLIRAIDDELTDLAERYKRNDFPALGRVKGFVRDAVALLRRREAYVSRLQRLAGILSVETPDVGTATIAETVHKLGLDASREFGLHVRVFADAIHREAADALQAHKAHDLDNMLAKYETAHIRPIGARPWLDDAISELEPMVARKQELAAIIAGYHESWQLMTKAQIKLCRKAIAKGGGEDTIAGQLRALRRTLAGFWKGSTDHVRLDQARRAAQDIRDRIEAIGNDPAATVLLDSLRGELAVVEKTLADIEAKCLDEITAGLKALVARVANGGGSAREELIREIDANPGAFAKGLGEDLARSWSESLLPVVAFVVEHEGRI